MKDQKKLTENKSMKNKIIAVVFVIVSGLLPARAAFSGTTGLWAGDVHLYEVSGVGRAQANVAFDLALTGLTESDSLIRKASAGWKYNNTEGDLGSAWVPAAYNDAGWPTSTGPIVFSSAGQPTAYFRMTFSVGSALKYSGMKLSLLKDDGAIIYLNGQEIYRSNLPSNISYATYAMSEISGANETAYTEISLPATLLQDGANVIAAEVHRSGASDADLRFDLELRGILNTSVSTNMINAKSTWDYIAEGTVPAAGWTGIAFNHTGWKNAPGSFGYGNANGSNGVKGQDTVLISGPSTGRYPAYYFRQEFTIPDKNAYTGLNVYLRRNDGAVVYLNGAEVVRSNMPEGTITSTTSPLVRVSAGETEQYLPFSIDASKLVNGNNVIAVEIHQHAAELTDSAIAAGNLTQTRADLTMHILLHADTTGVVRLLKEVIIMKDPTDGHTVLLTDDTLIPNFSGVAKKDGTTQGVRLSSVSYDFSGQSVQCVGGMSGLVTCNFTLGRTWPTNPFLHRYNPNHDEKSVDDTGNLNDIPSSSPFHEVNAVTRSMILTFSNRYPADPRVTQASQPPGWGEQMTGGDFVETLTGLVKDAIGVHGYFELRKVSDRGELNQ